MVIINNNKNFIIIDLRMWQVLLLTLVLLTLVLCTYSDKIIYNNNKLL